MVNLYIVLKSLTETLLALSDLALYVGCWLPRICMRKIIRWCMSFFFYLMQQLLIADIFFQNFNGFRILTPSTFFFVKADSWILVILTFFFLIVHPTQQHHRACTSTYSIYIPLSLFQGCLSIPSVMFATPHCIGHFPLPGNIQQSQWPHYCQ